MAVTTNSVPGLSDEVVARLNEAALTENRTVAEVVEDAVEKYLDGRSWARMFDYGQARAKALGYTEEDVERLIAETRVKKRSR